MQTRLGAAAGKQGLGNNVQKITDWVEGMVKDVKNYYSCLDCPLLLLWETITIKVMKLHK